jgi:hypothetical protein
MKNLQTNDLMALSFLIDDEIYITKDKSAIHTIKEESQFSSKEQSIENITSDVIIEKEEISSISAPTKPTKTGYKYLGENNKYILIIVKEPEADFLKPTDLNFLLKVLTAKKLALDDVAIINTEKNESLNFDDLKDFFACNKMITFGIDPKSLQITTAVANKSSIFKNTPILGTWDLQKLQLDAKKKGIFWDELKTF